MTAQNDFIANARKLDAVRLRVVVLVLPAGDGRLSDSRDFCEFGLRDLQDFRPDEFDRSHALVIYAYVFKRQ